MATTIETSGDLFTYGHSDVVISGDLFTEGHMEVETSGDLYVYGYDNTIASGNLYIVGPLLSSISGDLYVQAGAFSDTSLYILPRDNTTASGNLFIRGVENTDDSQIRIIHRLTSTSDYHPQLISTFFAVPVVVNIEVWDVGDGQNTKVTITNSGCYQIGNTGRWGWSTEYLPFKSEHKKYHYYYRMTSNENEQEYGEFIITVPEGGRWSYPN